MTDAAPVSAEAESAPTPLRGIWTPEEIAAARDANVGHAVSARQAEIQAVKDGLAFLTALAAGDGVLKGSTHLEAKAACVAVATFVRSVQAGLSSLHPDDDLQVLCEKDPTPHLLKFHAMHTEAP
jgi:hypothetical protein